MNDTEGGDSGEHSTDAIIELYSGLAKVEQRFNSTQGTIKTLASTWMLAAFTGIAFIVRGDGNLAWLIPQPVAVVLITFLGESGLLVLWIIDFRVYQMLLGGAFLAGLRMEFDYPFLPPMRALMMHAAGGSGMRHWLLCFYLIPMVVLWAVAMAFALFVGPESTQGWQLGQLQVSRPMLASIVSIIDGVLILVVLIASLRREARAADLFDNAEFTSLCGEGAFNAGELVKRYRPLTMRTEN